MIKLSVGKNPVDIFSVVEIHEVFNKNKDKDGRKSCFIQIKEVTNGSMYS